MGIEVRDGILLDSIRVLYTGEGNQPPGSYEFPWFV